MMADRGPRFQLPGQCDFKNNGCQSEVAMVM